VLGSRDESAFYQAETQMLVRENQMLRHRVRELERQLSEGGSNATTSSITREPAQQSRLIRSTSVSEEEPGATGSQNGATPQMIPLRPAGETPKDT
jgi:cell division septum initiation protein DivIVA